MRRSAFGLARRGGRRTPLAAQEPRERRRRRRARRSRLARLRSGSGGRAAGLVRSGARGRRAAAALLAERALRPHTTQRGALTAAGVLGFLSLELAIHVCLFPALNERNSQRAVAEIAKAATPAGAALAVYRNDTLAAAVGYYAGRPVRELREAGEVAAFFAEGGGAIVVEDEHLAELGGTPPLREVGRGRSRQRRLHVMAPDD